MRLPKAIINAMIYDYKSFYPKGYVIFSDTIIDCGPMESFDDQGFEIIDGTDMLVMPSLIVGHTHIYSTFARGWLNSFNYEGFMDILEKQWWRLDNALHKDAMYYSGIVNAIDHLKNGVTTLIDHHASSDVYGSLYTLKKAVTDTVGLRGLYAFETSDRFDVKACIQENVEFAAKKSNFHKGLFGLHASLSLSEETLKQVKANLGRSPIHIHVAEDKLDQEDCLKRYGERVIERLDRHGLLNPDSIITHALFIDENEADILKKRQCVVALNPSSNMNNAIDVPNYKLLKAKEIPVIVGNDGISSSITTEYLNLFYTQHLRENHPGAFTLNDLATIIDDTYAYVSRQLDIKLGRFQTDYVADIMMVPYVPPTPINKDNILGHLFFGMYNSFKPHTVFIQGERVLNAYNVSPSLMNTYRQASSHALKVWEKIKEELGEKS